MDDGFPSPPDRRDAPGRPILAPPIGAARPHPPHPSAARLGGGAGAPSPRSFAAHDAATGHKGQERRNWYLAYTQWRIGHLRHESTTFFRNSRHRSLIWFMVLSGNYDGAPPSLQDCISASACSPGTVRGIVAEAEAKNYFLCLDDPADSRKRRIVPSALCVAEYEAMVAIFLRLAELLDHRDLASMVNHASVAALRTPRHGPGFGAWAEAEAWGRAYARWRLAHHRAEPRHKSVRFFRRSRPHTSIWMAVMESHYTGRPVALNECIRSVNCSKDTARKIVNAAIHAGHFVFDTAPEDNRKKLVRPSPCCIAEYQSMVDMLLRLADVLQPKMEEMRGQFPRRHRPPRRGTQRSVLSMRPETPTKR